MSQNETIAKRLSELREKKGITQQEVAEMLHVKRATVANYETGKRAPDYDTLIKLADYYGVSCDFILRGVRSEFADIHRIIGLNDEAISSLSYYTDTLKKSKPPTDASNILNRFISSGKLLELIAIMTDYSNELEYATNLIDSAIVTLKQEEAETNNDQKLDVFPRSSFDRELNLYLFEMQELAKGFIQDYAKKQLTEYSDALVRLDEINKIHNEYNIRTIAIERLKKKVGDDHGNDPQAK